MGKHGRLWIAVVVALALRLLFFWVAYTHNQGFFVQPDTPSYVVPALNMLKHHSFSEGIYPDIRPEIVRTPGYPLFLAAVFFLFGTRIAYILIVQIVISLLIVFMVYKIASLIGEEDAGFWASLIAALNPSLIISANKILTGTLYAVLLLLGLYFVIVFVHRKGSFPLLLFGFLVLSLAAFVRPIGMYLGIVLAVVLFFWMLKVKFGFKRSILYVASMLLIFLLPIFFWSYRNYTLTGFRGFSAIQPWNLLNFEAASALALRNGSVRREEAKRLMNEVLRKSRGKSFGEVYNVMQGEAMKVILANKWYFTIMQLKGIAAVWASTRAGDLFVAMGGFGMYPDFGKYFYNMGIREFISFMWKNYKEILLLHFVMLVFYLIEYLFSLFGLVSRKWSISVVVIVLTIVYLSLLSGGSAGTARFKIQIEPLISVLAGVGIVAWKQRKSGIFQEG